MLSRHTTFFAAERVRREREGGAEFQKLATPRAYNWYYRIAAIKVENTIGRNFTITDLWGGMLVEDLKLRVEKSAGFPPGSVRLIY